MKSVITEKVKSAKGVLKILKSARDHKKLHHDPEKLASEIKKFPWSAKVKMCEKITILIFVSDAEKIVQKS